MKGYLVLNRKISRYVATVGLLLSGFALFCSVLFGFGGFNIDAFTAYLLTGYVSRVQMFFITLTGLGLFLSAIGYAYHPKNKETKNHKLIPLLYLIVSIVFFVAAIFGLTSQLRSADFWGNTVFEEIQNTLIFSNLTLACFLALGILQVIMSILFSKIQTLGQSQLSKAAKILILTSGILLIIKAIIDIPLIKESIFILSYMLKVPFLNNIIGIVAPIFFLCAQILVASILLQNQKPLTTQ